MELIDLVNSDIVFFISSDLTQIVNVLTQIHDCDSHSPSLLDFVLSSDASVCCPRAFSHRKYQVKPHSSPWCLAVCDAVIVHRNHFFHLYQQNKCSESKVKFRQANNGCNRVLEVAEFAYATKTKESITSQELGSRDFWRIANSVLKRGNSALPLLFNEQEVLPSAPDKAKLFVKNFSTNSA